METGIVSFKTDIETFFDSLAKLINAFLVFLGIKSE